MKYRILTILALLLASSTFGCSADVETTEDSTKIETELPKVETGDEDVDIDPGTDDDIDIDTPVEGDS